MSACGKSFAVVALASALALPAPAAWAVYHGHKFCDPAIDDYDDAISADSGLAGAKARVDESWRALGAHGDPDMRAATRARRSDWLCEVKTACGPNVAASRTCIAKAIAGRTRANDALAKTRESGQGGANP